MAVSEAPPQVERDIRREYVAGGFFPWYTARRSSKHSLPWTIDDLSGEFGLTVYEKMLLDSQVYACSTYFKASILEDGVALSSPIKDSEEDGFERAQEILDAANRMFDNMDTYLDEVLEDLLTGMCFGNKVAEVVYAVEDGALNLKRLKVKPNRSVAYVVDEYLNVIGLLGDIQGTGIVQGYAIEPKDILPLEKFVVYRFRPHDADPRGSSILRAAYDPWWRKQTLMPDLIKWLAQFAGPSVIGFLQEGATLEKPVTMEDGSVATTPAEAMLASLLAWRSGSAAAFPFGAKVDILKAEGDGKGFFNALGQCNLEITKAILTQQLATEEGEFMARAAAEVHENVLDTLIRQGKRSVARMIGVQILRRWVNYNYGAKAIPLTPRATLGTIEHQDKAPLYNAVANLVRAGFFTSEQLAELDKILGFPVRSKAELAPAVQPKPAPQGQPAPVNNKDGEPADAKPNNKDGNDTSEEEGD